MQLIDRGYGNSVTLGDPTFEAASKAVQHAEGRHAYRFIKRSFDIAVSSVAIVLSAIPVAICCAAVSAESPGNPIFYHERVGRWGRPLRILKIRSMYSDAEENLEKYLTPEQIEEWHTEHKIENDPRITPVGKFLRATSLDEFPQFVNVLTGEMSLIGPRPVVQEEIDDYFSDTKEELLSIKPGLTGYWQAYARNDATFESGERQKMELFYVRNRSIMLDLKIFFKTFVSVFTKTGQ